MTELAGVASPAAARMGRHEGSVAIVSRRAALAALALTLIVLAECVAFASLQPEGSAFAYWSCAACHA